MVGVSVKLMEGQWEVGMALVVIVAPTAGALTILAYGMFSNGLEQRVC